MTKEILNSKLHGQNLVQGANTSIAVKKLWVGGMVMVTVNIASRKSAWLNWLAAVAYPKEMNHKHTTTWLHTWTL